MVNIASYAMRCSYTKKVHELEIGKKVSFLRSEGTVLPRGKDRPPTGAVRITVFLGLTVARRSRISSRGVTEGVEAGCYGGISSRGVTEGLGHGEK